MKNYTIFALLAAIITLFFIFTGFQCSSQEMTSAKLYIQRQDWETAEKWLNQETEKNPTNAEAWWLLGNARMQRADFKKSLEAYDNCSKNSNEYDERISQAKKYIWGQSLNKGVGAYNQSLTDSTGKAPDFRKQALENYNIALSINPDTFITYQYIAIVHRADGNFENEISTLKEGMKHNAPSDLHISLINAYLQKAQAAEAKSNKQEAAVDYNNAISAILEARKLDPSNAELLTIMIDLYIRTGKADEAKPYIREAIAKDPSNKTYQYNLGVLLMQTDSLDEAITHFEAALQTDPNYDVALQNIGVAYLRIGDKMKQATQGQDMKKNVDKTYIEKFKKSVGYFEKLSEIKKDDPAVLDLLASAYANANMLKEAKAALEKADSLRKK
ncbi:MAG: tetratricopeptide repeat protein [Ignavibacteriales bacterium]|nr:tetratricopeptide repeat protein [Ignavibacteriales bacterium]